MQSRIIRNSLWLILAVFILLIDQITKSFAVSALEFGVTKPLIPGLSFTLAHNTGAAFSLFYQGGGWQVIVFIIFALIASVYLIFWLLNIKGEDNLTRLAICLILGGSLGNMLDRVFNGYVIDFILVYYKNYHWPIFNVADSGITVGAIILVYCFFTKSVSSSK